MNQSDNEKQGNATDVARGSAADYVCSGLRKLMWAYSAYGRSHPLV